MVNSLNHWLADSSLFQKATYRVLITVGATAVMQRTVANLLDMGTDLNLLNNLFLLWNWKLQFKPMKPLLLQTVTRQAVSAQGHISLPIFTEDLQAGPWLRIAENPEVAILLGTSFINNCICGIF